MCDLRIACAALIVAAAMACAGVQFHVAARQGDRELHRLFHEVPGCSPWQGQYGIRLDQFFSRSVGGFRQPERCARKADCHRIRPSKRGDIRVRGLNQMVGGRRRPTRLQRCCAAEIIEFIGMDLERESERAGFGSKSAGLLICKCLFSQNTSTNGSGKRGAWSPTIP